MFANAKTQGTSTAAIYSISKFLSPWNNTGPCLQNTTSMLGVFDRDGITLDQLKADVLLFMVAGSDTTAIMIRTIITLMLQYPDIHRKLNAEMDSRTWSDDDYPPYLLACIKETLRFRPPASDPFPRITPPQGLTLTDGTYIPAGIEVGMNPWTNNRDKEVFGEDAEEFVPERWTGDPEKIKEMGKFSNTFGYGPRVCLGRDLAEQEIRVVLLRFWQEFDVKEVVEKGLWENYGLLHHVDLKVKVTRRKSAGKV